MNYFPFHVGDYAAHTAHLEPLEDLAYRRMLDLYYLRESALPKDPAEVARLVRMRANVAEVEAVLREFFTETSDGWINARADQEILRMQDKQAKAKASAEASVAARQARANKARSTPAEPTLNERSTNVELPTPTPTPTPTPVITPSVEGVSRKRSATPSTKPNRATVLPENFVPNETAESIARETGVDLQREFASFCDHHTAKASTFSDWQAAFRTWLRNASKFHQSRPVQRSVPAQRSFAQNDREEAMRRWEEMTGETHPDRMPVHGGVIDITPRRGTLQLEG